jgi:hypothetical protein
MIKNRVKDNIIETQYGIKMLQDLQDGCVLKGLLHEIMNSMAWHHTMKGLNLHMAQAHLDKNPMALHAIIFKATHLVK